MSAESEYRTSRREWLSPPFRISDRPWVPAPSRVDPREIQARWKAGWGRSVWMGVVLAAGLHLAILHQVREVKVAPPDIGSRSPVSQLVIPRVAQISMPAAPPAIVAPDQPEPDLFRLAVHRPITPSIAEVPAVPKRIAEIAMPAPPITPADRNDWTTYERFAPTMVMPEILNRDEMRRFLERRYQSLVRRSGIQGTAVMRFWIDELGLARRAEVHESTGHHQLDDLALELARMLRFSPAIQNGEATRVIVEVPIRFRAI